MDQKAKVVVFDVDGTLVDTRRYIVDAYAHVLERHGFPARSEEEISSQIGKSMVECYDLLAPGHNMYEELRATHDEFQSANIGLIEAFQGVEELISDLLKKEYGLAIWTGRSHQITESLDQAGVRHTLFDPIVLPTHTTQGKPDPEGLRIVAEHLGVPAHSLVMVGDAVVDIEAGRRAGATTIAVTHGFGVRKDLESANPDYIVDSLGEIAHILR